MPPTTLASSPRGPTHQSTPRPAKPEIHPLSPDQARKLLATALETKDRFEALYVLALHCRLRAGELLGRHFKPPLKRAELPPIRFHDLRHTCATILLMAAKHPKYVQELLGHASINITLDTYSHVFKGMDGGLGDAMDEAL